MKKKLAIIGGILGALMIVGIIIVGQSLDTIIRKGIEYYGEHLLDVPVSLKEVAFSPSEGKIELEGLMIDNPQGFDSPHAFVMDSIRLQLNTEKTSQRFIHIQEISIVSPQIVMETSQGKTNLKALLQNLQAQTKEETTTTESKPGEQVKLVIERFALTQAKVKMHTPRGAGFQPSIQLPDVIIKDLGVKEGGITPKQLAHVFLQRVQEQLAQHLANPAFQQKMMEGLFKGKGPGKLRGVPSDIQEKLQQRLKGVKEKE